MNSTFAPVGKRTPKPRARQADIDALKKRVRYLYRALGFSWGVIAYLAWRLA